MNEAENRIRPAEIRSMFVDIQRHLYADRH